MNAINRAAGFGTLFSTLAALTSPRQEFVTSRPAGRAAPERRLRTAANARVEALVAAWRRGQERARLSRALARLDDHLLQDIGVSRVEIDAGFPPPFTQPGDPASARTLVKRLKHIPAGDDIGRKQSSAKGPETVVR
jgi:uncharacterized protein YjiS (DUF1127 family)